MITLTIKSFRGRVRTIDVGSSLRSLALDKQQIRVGQPIQLREREHVRNRPTRLLRPIRLRRIADGNEECRDLIIAETKLT